MVQERDKNYDAIVCLPYSSNIGSNGKIRLSYWSAQSIHAAYHLYSNGRADKILIPGESPFGQENVSTTSLMVRYLEAKGVPVIAMIARDNLNNTVIQLEEVRSIQNQTGLDSLLFIACSWHKERVEQTLKSLSIKGDTVEVESVLAGNHNRTSRGKMLAVPATRRMNEKDERIRTNFISNRLVLQRIFGKVFGARVVDLRDDTFAIFKKRQLKKSSSQPKKSSFFT